MPKTPHAIWPTRCYGGLTTSYHRLFTSCKKAKRSKNYQLFFKSNFVATSASSQHLYSVGKGLQTGFKKVSRFYSQKRLHNQLSPSWSVTLLFYFFGIYGRFCITAPAKQNNTKHDWPFLLLPLPSANLHMTWVVVYPAMFTYGYVE